MSAIYIAEKAKEEISEAKPGQLNLQRARLNNLVGCSRSFMAAANNWNDNLPYNSQNNFAPLKLMATSLRNMALDAEVLGVNTIVVPVAAGTKKAEAVSEKFKSITGGKSSVELRFI